MRKLEHALSISRSNKSDCDTASKSETVFVHDDNVTVVANESQISVNIVPEPDIANVLKPGSICVKNNNVSAFESLRNSNTNPTKLRFVSMNVKGINEKFSIPGHLNSLTSCDVILLCETWLQKQTKLKKFRIPGYEPFNNFRKHMHKKARRASGGMIVYIKNELLKYINVVKTVCDHFMVLEIKGLTEKPTFIIFSYIIPKDTTYLCKTCDGNYFDALTDLVVKFSNKGYVGVCGDLNGRTADLSDEPTELQINLPDSPNSDLAPPKWYQSNSLSPRVSMDATHNSQGLDLLSLCHSSGLRIMNGRCFKDKGIGDFTYSINGNKSVIDYLLLCEKLSCKLSDFEVGMKWPDSDHAPLYFEFIATTPMPRGTCENRSTVLGEVYNKFVFNKDSKEALCQSLFDETRLLHLQNFNDCIADLCSGEEVAKSFNKYIHQACTKSLKCKNGVKSKPKFPVNKWFDNECKEVKSQYTAACKERHRTKHNINSKAIRKKKYYVAHRKCHLVTMQPC